MGQIWNSKRRPRAPEGMLEGTIYDYDRNSQGDRFKYSFKYQNVEPNKLGRRTLRSVMAERRAGSSSISPDSTGQLCKTLKLLVEGKEKALSALYPFPHSIAAAYFYLPPKNSSYLSELLEANNSSTSDWVVENENLDRETRTTRWLAVFKGHVVAPRTMRFRFFGAADDYMMVKFNDRIVLETGFICPSEYSGQGKNDFAIKLDTIRSYNKKLKEGRVPGKLDYVVRKLRSTPYCNDMFGGLTGGSVIDVEKGEVCSIEITIGNLYGVVLYYLLTQEMSKEGNAPLQLFRTNDTMPETDDYNMYESGPVFQEDSDIWEAIPRK